ncbi:MAG: transposase [Leptospirillum sp.]
MTEHLGADRHKWMKCSSYRSGIWERRLGTRVETLILRVSKTRHGGFSTGLLHR